MLRRSGCIRLGATMAPQGATPPSQRSAGRGGMLIAARAKVSRTRPAPSESDKVVIGERSRGLASMTGRGKCGPKTDRDKPVHGSRPTPRPAPTRAATAAPSDRAGPMESRSRFHFPFLGGGGCRKAMPRSRVAAFQPAKQISRIPTKPRDFYAFSYVVLSEPFSWYKQNCFVMHTE